MVKDPAWLLAHLAALLSKLMPFFATLTAQPCQPAGTAQPPYLARALHLAAYVHGYIVCPLFLWASALGAGSKLKSNPNA